MQREGVGWESIASNKAQSLYKVFSMVILVEQSLTCTPLKTARLFTALAPN